jgi:hypothetical protein
MLATTRIGPLVGVTADKVLYQFGLNLKGCSGLAKPLTPRAKP